MSYEIPPWHGAAALVYVDDVKAPMLSDTDLHHFRRVRRFRPGERLCVSDGNGAWRIARFTEGPRLEPTDESGQQSAPERSVAVGFALSKADKPELVVQKLTEIGVDRIYLFRAERSVTKWGDEKASRNLDRLNRVARGAGEQSRRLHLPVIELAELRDLVVTGVAVADFGGRALTERDSIVLVGPEGGWSPGEYGDAETVSLSTNVLRAETAAISAGVQLCGFRDRENSIRGNTP